MKTYFCWRRAGSPRAIRRVMVLIAAQRIMASETAGVAFVVPCQTAVRGDPGQGPLDHPPPRNDSESALLRRFAHDLDRGLEDRVRPVQQASGEPGVGVDEPHPVRRYRSSRIGLAPSRSCTEAEHTIVVSSRPRVSVTMNRFRPLIFFPRRSSRVLPDGVSALHGLGVDDPRAGFGVAALVGT